KWFVMMKRQLSSQQEGEVEITPDNNLKIAFAIWDGAQVESLGIKSISILGTLILKRNRE
nr:hypothetical protein [Candidatus Saccharibacteria bacterium]NIV04125.1 hypothetical protein [Calditrichia bacterium]NIV72528.1 hypothetical protein [Calditrichia bacterium]NIV99642.1 hypothetical protein [Candidatus Saccharibacteria bacterium]NIW79745.1 hypothetical protein [Calditrichia bacterium]